MAIKREVNEPHAGDKRYVRRDPEGKFKKGRRRRPLSCRGQAKLGQNYGQAWSG